MSRKNSVGTCDGLFEEIKTPQVDFIAEIPNLETEEVPSRGRRRSSVMSSTSSLNAESKSGWKSLVDATDEFGKDSKKLYKFIKRRLSSKKKKRETEVKAISIVPDEEENMKWANRPSTRSPPCSAHSRTSTGTGTSSVGSKDDDGIETVHDMDDEYNVFHGC
ncbi:hypothetical protein LOTGIDRAFT_238162 [Lottia gigantea]|uniref:Uncharacterized protein n=1 Tax=Lottia gigantea TaxID=225164 RepID=V4B280_LOTGI|nr:hypothetical protein LOTGIDRAFT_238162 [Lottia gigantea]ESP01776.1 hypothetical protein LOTGIDRAFT_238162 [Lottia gigantea]